MTPLHDLLPGFRGLILFCIFDFGARIVSGAPATSGAVGVVGALGVEIADGQIQVPASPQSATTLYKAINVAGHEIVYIGSVGLNSLGSSTTWLQSTTKLTTTVDSGGSIITGVAEIATVSGSWSTTLVPESSISALRSTPPSFAYSTLGSNGKPIINVAQQLIRSNGSAFTIVLESGISTMHVTSLDSHGSAVPYTVGVFTLSNGSVVTSTLFFSHPASSSRSYVATITTPSQTTNAVTTQHSSTTTSTRPHTSNQRYVLSESAVSSVTHELQPTINQPDSSRTLSASSTDVTASSNLAHTSSKHTLTLASPSLTTSNATITSIPQVGIYSSRTNSRPGYGVANSSSMRGSLSVSPSSTVSPSATTATTNRSALLLIRQSNTALGSLIPLALAQQLPTITTVPPGMSIETVTSTSCSTFGAMVTTTAAGSTVTQTVPELCWNGIAYLLFGWAAIPSLCRVKLGLFGFLIHFICGPSGIIPLALEVDSPPIDTPPSSPNGSPENRPPDDPEDDQDSSNTRSQPSPTRSGPASNSVSGSMQIPSKVSSSGVSSSSLVIDTWVEVLAPFVTGSIVLPASASVIKVPGTPVSVNSATLAAFFASAAADMVAYFASFPSPIFAGYINGTAYSTVPLESSANSFPIPLRTTLVTHSSISAVSALPSLACTKFLFFPDDGPNSFVCQCNDGTWNHRKAQESYSECPSQVTSTALTTTTSMVILPSTVSCTLVVFGPGSPTWGPPFCECPNNFLFLGSCPVSVSARTTTLTLSEPVTPGANAIPTFTTDPSAAVCTEVPSLSIKCVAPSPVVVPPPSPTTAACTPRCTKLLGPERQGGEQPVSCHCNPACGGYPYPSPNSDGICPYQVY